MKREYLTSADLAKRPRPRDIVEGLIYEGCMSLWAGPAKSGKTFLLTDLAHAVATGRAWAGRAVDKGGVLYIPLEGVGMLYDRIRAWEIANKQRSPIIFSPTPLNLLTDTEHVEEIMDYVEENEVRLVVLDTLARATAGIQENAKEEISLAVAALDRIKDETGAHIAVTHHHGHGAKRARGSSDLLAAPDLIVDLEHAKGADERTATVTANRHGKEGETMRFTLEPVKTDIVDARGRAVMSANVKLLGEWFEDHDASDAGDGLSERERAALDVLRPYLRSLPMARKDALKRLRREGWGPTGAKGERTWSMAAGRALRALEDAGIIDMDSNDDLFLQ
jgi:hypothetical protein